MHFTITEKPVVIDGVQKDGIRFSAVSNETGQEIGHVYLYWFYNDSRPGIPCAHMEDLRVEDAGQRKGVGRALTMAMLARSKELGHYKIVANSRTEREHVHKLYLSCGFVEHGKNFRIEF